LSKERLDTLLNSQGLCNSRALAQKLIRAGKVKVKGQIVDKPGTLISVDSPIEVKSEPPFVSMGGEKLVKALEYFAIDVDDRICLDGGISTGGFTDCLFQRGAKKVYGIDVGYGQVAWKIRHDERLVLRERTNFRYLTYDDLYQDSEPPNLGVMDLSFISLTKVLPTLWELLVNPKEVVLLVKPQFEVGKGKVGKKGVVRDYRLQSEAIASILNCAINIGWKYKGLIASPIQGPAGNVEYLLWLGVSGEDLMPSQKDLDEITQKAMDK